MSIVPTVPDTRPGFWLSPTTQRPSKSSAQLIELARRACLTHQPRLAMTYLEAADVARVFERVQAAAEWITIVEAQRRHAALRRINARGETVGAFLRALFGLPGKEA
jgi:uncharacterized protein YqgV (UPF0045/DUF77 family)